MIVVFKPSTLNPLGIELWIEGLRVQAAQTALARRTSMVEGLGVQGLAFGSRVWGQGLTIRMTALRSRVRVSGQGCRVKDLGLGFGLKGRGLIPTQKSNTPLLVPASSH